MFVEKRLNFCAFRYCSLHSSNLTLLFVSHSCCRSFSFSTPFFFFLLFLFACFIYFVCLPIFIQHIHTNSTQHTKYVSIVHGNRNFCALRIELQNMKMHKNHANIANQTKMTTQNTTTKRHKHSPSNNIRDGKAFVQSVFASHSLSSSLHSSPSHALYPPCMCLYIWYLMIFSRHAWQNSTY